MPDIVNNVINGLYPASGHSIYVCELAPYDNPSLYIQQTKYYGGFRVTKNKIGTRSHLWDLYLISANMLDRETHSSNNFFYKRFSFKDYKPLFCSTFTDNAGDNVYQAVSNFSGLSVLNHPVFSNYQYTGSFTFNPILSTKINQQYAAEIIIYRASYFPLYPLLFCSSIPTHTSFGPAFINNFQIAVDGDNNLGDVEISCSLTGGRSVISPPPGQSGVGISRTHLTGDYIKMKSLDESKFNVEFNNFTNQYRAINLSDCAFYPDAFTGEQAFYNFGNAVQNSYSSGSMPIYKIVSMSLSIQQQIEFTYTYPGYSINNNLIEFSDVAGPRFASLSNRKVTGSLKLFSPQNYSFINANASSLTLYFGSVFYYSMKNVDWQQPVITINPNKGYYIEYNFTARLNEFTSFNGLNDTRVSEFL